jgi:hypothetical protein
MLFGHALIFISIKAIGFVKSKLGAPQRSRPGRARDRGFCEGVS